MAVPTTYVDYPSPLLPRPCSSAGQILSSPTLNWFTQPLNFGTCMQQKAECSVMQQCAQAGLSLCNEELRLSSQGQKGGAPPDVPQRHFRWKSPRRWTGMAFACEDEEHLHLSNYLLTPSTPRTVDHVGSHVRQDEASWPYTILSIDHMQAVRLRHGLLMFLRHQSPPCRCTVPSLSPSDLDVAGCREGWQIRHSQQRPASSSTMACLCRRSNSAST